MKSLALTSARPTAARSTAAHPKPAGLAAAGPRLAGLAAALVVVGFVAACGGSGGEQNTPAAANFADCLRQQGITLNVPSGRPTNFPTARPSGFPGGNRPSGFPGGGPSGGPGQGRGPGGGFGNFQRPEGVDEQTWQKALQACGSLRPSGFPGGGGPGASRGPGRGAQAAYLNCLSEHGVTYSPGQTLPEDAKVCEALRPSGTGTP